MWQQREDPTLNQDAQEDASLRRQLRSILAAHKIHRAKGKKSPLGFPGAGQLAAVALGLQGKKKKPPKEHHSGCSPDLLFSRCLQRFCF